MAKSKKDSDTEYVLKKGGSDVPVDPCKGWVDPCEYCDKRFGAWVPEDEVYEKIPDKPGFFMVALKTKNATEVVSLLYAESNIQKSAINVMDEINDQVSNKKTKSTKSTLQVRWMVVKKVGDKDSIVVCAHWNNNGSLPKFTKTWPGLSLLENSDYLMLSKHLQKWCYAKKDPVWRKPKPPSSKIVEEVKKCTYESPCEICDTYFTKWQNLSEVVEKNRAPSTNGLVMISIVIGKRREVIQISSDYSSVTVNINNTVQDAANREKYYQNHEKFKNTNSHLEVRWIEIKDVDSDNSCFLYAHFSNADRLPTFNQLDIPFKKHLDKNKHFVLRKHDEKWMYEIEAFKQEKFSKQKNKRSIRADLEDDEYLLDTEEQN